MGEMRAAYRERDKILFAYDGDMCCPNWDLGFPDHYYDWGLNMRGSIIESGLTLV